ncbi:hypothetical protein [uncultured Pseudacidovorax sp.]|uniref:hypothetical protein n=1 Tax=uncultured Pseudacidovorax sp. TaxID=679313 RepID=UPI0025E4B166|nr:hypothetical protein [uncultured Pseudacidovorax sp.]
MKDQATPALELSTITLSATEIIAIAGGYLRASDQVRELQRQGFWRARKGVRGEVVLEREHYRAVCAGARFGKVAPEERPKIIPPPPSKYSVRKGGHADG